MKIGLTNVYVNNPAKAFKFYTKVLGFVRVMYVPENNLAIVASPQDPDGTALLLEPNDNPFAKSYQTDLYKAGLPTIVFITEDCGNS